MKLLKNKQDFEEFKISNGYICDDNHPKEYPCYVYSTVCNSTDYEESPIFLYHNNISEMFISLFPPVDFF